MFMVVAADVLGYNVSMELLQSNTYVQQVTGLIGTTYIQLLLMTFGLFLYGFFVWKFYRTLSKRDLFKLDLDKYNIPGVEGAVWFKIGDTIGYIFKYLIVFPIYISFWFVALSLVLFILAEEILTEHVILISIVVIAAVRMTSYFNEDLASDIAKLVPLALLAVLLTDPTFFSVDKFIERVIQIPSVIGLMLDSLIFSISLEWTLRILYGLKVLLFGDHDYENEE